MILRLSHAFAAAATTLSAPALAETRYSSQVPGLALVALDALPAARGDQTEAEFCDHLFVATPETAAGRAAQAQGWKVTTELPFGDLTAVSFVGGAIPATSGTCELVDGNVGFFSGDQLVALLYRSEGDDPMIGRMEPFGEGGLRVFSGDLLPSPVADVQGSGTDDIAAVTLADEEPVCGGTASVPNIYNLPIDKARIRLIEAGWQPVPGDLETQSQSWASHIAAAGVPEVDECSGTGFAFCAYSYTRPIGELSVVTAGEGGEDGGLPFVSSYGVTCR
jgi:hypothetical protein